MTGESNNSFVPQPPQKPNPWIIVIVVIVLMCCCCVGVVGLLSAFGKPILNSLGIQSWLPQITSI